MGRHREISKLKLPDSISDIEIEEQEINKSPRSTVHFARLPAYKLPLIVKRYDTKELDGDEPQEYNIVRNLGRHPMIVRYFGIRKDEQYMEVVMERGVLDLWQVLNPEHNKRDKICAKRFTRVGRDYNNLQPVRYIKERYVRRWFGKIVEAIVYCHKGGVFHRDIRLANIVLFPCCSTMWSGTEWNLSKCRCDRKMVPKLIDFDLAIHREGKNKPYFDGYLRGNIFYIAPEIWLYQRKEKARPYKDAPVDVWALGVLLFAMLAGRLPFYEKPSDDSDTSSIEEEEGGEEGGEKGGEEVGEKGGEEGGKEREREDIVEKTKGESDNDWIDKDCHLEKYIGNDWKRKDIHATVHTIVNIQYTFPTWFSMPIRQLLSGIFVKNPSDRSTLLHILNSEWMKGSKRKENGKREKNKTK